MIRPLASLAAALLLLSGLPAAAQQTPARPAPAAKPAPAAQPDRGSPLAGLGSNSKEPIKIDADRLDVFDRENRAVYTGNVVAVQGDTTIRCTTLTIFFERQRGGAATPARAPAGGGDQNDAIRRIDCAGPVTIVSKDQVATGNDAVYDRVAGRVVMTGNVALSQGPNVTRGERLVYDVNAGVANVETAPGGRVRGLFVPGSTPDAKPAAAAAPAPQKPAAAAAAQPRPARPPATN